MNLLVQTLPKNIDMVLGQDFIFDDCQHIPFTKFKVVLKNEVVVHSPEVPKPDIFKFCEDRETQFYITANKLYKIPFIGLHIINDEDSPIEHSVENLAGIIGQQTKRVQDALKAFADVFQDRFPKGLPCDREGIFLKIDLFTQEPLPVRNLYCLNKMQLEELRKQLKKLKYLGFIKVSCSFFCCKCPLCLKKEW